MQCTLVPNEFAVGIPFGIRARQDQREIRVGVTMPAERNARAIHRFGEGTTCNVAAADRVAGGVGDRTKANRFRGLFSGVHKTTYARRSSFVCTKNAYRKLFPQQDTRDSTSPTSGHCMHLMFLQLGTQVEPDSQEIAI